MQHWQKNTGLKCEALLHVNETLVLVTVCQDGTVIVHTVRRGQFLRTLRPPNDACIPAQISKLQVGMEGHIVVQSSLEEHSNRVVREYRCSNAFECTCTFLFLLMSLTKGCLILQGMYSVYVYSVNGCLLSSFTMEEQVTALHLMSEYVILGTLQGSLHIRDLYR